MLTTALLLIFPLHLLPQQDNGTSYRTVSAPDAAQTAATNENVEVFRRLLTRGLHKIGERRNDELFAGNGWSTFNIVGFGEGHSRGYHLPGVGAFYSLDLSLPVVEDHGTKESAQEEERPRTEADREWERMRRRVLTGQGDEEATPGPGLFGSLQGVRDRRWKLDEAAIDEVEREALRLLGRYGSRIEGLRGEETVTVALHLSGNSNLPVIASTGEPDGTAAFTTWSNIYASKEVAPVRLVLSVPVRALQDYGADGADEGNLRRSARIYRY